MKKVRFESPMKIYKMNEFECHSPRPFLEEALDPTVPMYNFKEARILTYSSDPLQRYEQSNSIPISSARQTELSDVTCTVSRCLPSSDLDLSMLDGSNSEPRKHVVKNVIINPDIKKNHETSTDCQITVKPNVETIQDHPLKTSSKDNTFFIKRGNLANYQLNSLKNGFRNISIDKENNPLVSKFEMMSSGTKNHNVISPVSQMPAMYVPDMSNESDCNCHHCIQVMQRKMACLINDKREVFRPGNRVMEQSEIDPQKMLNPYVQQDSPSPDFIQQKSCNCNCKSKESLPKNAVNKKAWAILRYENHDTKTMEVEKQMNVSKEKREPTVADLFKIIKLQNEQLQLLQEKVDKFISTGNSQPIPNVSKQLPPPIANSPAPVTNIADCDRKISIGVMTSFEMVCTSTVINKEIFKSTKSAQIQCNRSQISIKEVVSKSPMNKNFLDGLRPTNTNDAYKNNSTMQCKNDMEVNTSLGQVCPIMEEKTLNEQSLYNVQVDNETTPLMSPEQTLYLDVRDYSDSDCSSYNQSNVGWTYYNKVMSHVNGVLQDSDMPSSASAMYRNMRQQCVQMHAITDKTNVSVTKRVQFGEDVLISRPTHYNIPASTDTSLRMNQLAAKYLKDSANPLMIQQAPAKQTVSNDMSLATKNYMERHHLIQGQGAPAKTPYTGEMPKFLDITALKQQPKLL